MTFSSSVVRVLVAVGLSSLSVFGSDEVSRDSTQSRREDINIRGVFTSDLPDVGRKHSLRLIWHPHLADLVKYDYFRTDLGLKYTLSSRLELRAFTSSYFAHGLGDAGFFDDAGFGAVQFGAKFRFKEKLLGRWESAIGTRYSIPINDPPADVTDGLEHRTLFATFARPLKSHPNLRVFWGIGADFVQETSFAGRNEDNDLRDSNHYLSGGLVIDRERTHYTLEGKWTTTRLLGNSSQDVFELRPGVVWELGGRRADGRASRWLLGLSLSSTFGPDGTEIGLGARVRMDLDLKRLWKRDNKNDSVTTSP